MAKKAATKTAVKKAPTKSQIFAELAEKTELSKKQIAEVFDELNAMI